MRSEGFPFWIWRSGGWDLVCTFVVLSSFSRRDSAPCNTADRGSSKMTSCTLTWSVAAGRSIDFGRCFCASNLWQKCDDDVGASFIPKIQLNFDWKCGTRIGEAYHPGPAASAASRRRRKEKMHFQPEDGLSSLLAPLLQPLLKQVVESLMKQLTQPLGGSLVLWVGKVVVVEVMSSTSHPHPRRCSATDVVMKTPDEGKHGQGGRKTLSIAPKPSKGWFLIKRTRLCSSAPRIGSWIFPRSWSMWCLGYLQSGNPGTQRWTSCEREQELGFGQGGWSVGYFSSSRCDQWQVVFSRCFSLPCLFQRCWTSVSGWGADWSYQGGF